MLRLLFYFAFPSLTRFPDIVVMDSLHTCTPSASFVVYSGSPHSVIKYIFRYGRYLEANGIGAMRSVGDHPSIYDDRSDKNLETTVGASIKHRCECGGRGARSPPCAHELADSPFIWCYEEVDYEHRLGAIVSSKSSAKDGSIPTNLSQVVWFSRPYYQMCLIPSWLHWVTEVAF